MPPRLPESPPQSPRRSRSAGFRLLAVLALAATLVAQPGCRPDSQLEPQGREPALLIEGASLVRLLERVAGLAGTPAGTASRQLALRLGDCPEIAAHFPRPANARSASNDASAISPSAISEEPAVESFAARLDRLACRDDRPLDPSLAALLEHERGPHAGLLQWPIGEAGRLVLRIDVDDAGGLAVDGFLDEANDDGPAALLVPAAAAPGPATIDRAVSLVHLHLRPANGLRLAQLIPQGSQGDRLFALKGRLLEGTLLEGTLELGFVPPAPGGTVPLAIVALHHRAAAPIEAALGEALAQLERTWGLVRTPRSFAIPGGERTGGCYADLPILPEFAPCWVVTDDALLVGYRAEAVEAALAGGRAPATADARETHALVAANDGANDGASEGGADPATDPAATSGIVVDFDRVRALDASIAGPSGASFATLYSRLELRGRTGRDGRVVLEGLLRARR